MQRYEFFRNIMQYFEYIRIFIVTNYSKNKNRFMKKTVFKVAALLFAGMMATACGSGKQAVQPVDLNGEWNIVTVNGDTVNAANAPFIGLDMAEKRVYGNAGCNRMTGSFEADSLHPGKIQFGQIGTTRMMCPDMDTESKVLQALSNVKGYSGTEQGLSLTDAEGKTLLTLEKRETPAFSASDLNGEWLISSINGTETGEMENTPYLAFDFAEKRVHGNAGCNIINGGFSQEEGEPNSLKFSQMISTMMACPDMETERKILDALGKVTSFSANADETVSLLDESGTEVLTLTRNTGTPLSKAQ